MFDKDSKNIWEVFTEAHRAIPYLPSERPILQTVSNIFFKYKKLKLSYNNIIKDSFKEEISNYYAAEVFYNDVIQYLEYLFRDQDFESYIDPNNKGYSITYSLERNTEDSIDNVIYNFRRLTSLEDFNIEDSYNRLSRDAFESQEEKYLVGVYSQMKDLSELSKKFVENLKESKKYNKYEYEHGDKSKLYPLGKTEILYHASINAVSLFKNGFSKEGKHGGGLGTGNQDREISFTLDLYVAKNIAKSFKICWMIANGKWKWNDFIRWIDKEKKDKFTIKDILKQLALNSKLKTPESHPETVSDFIACFTTSLWFIKSYNPVFAFIDYQSFVDQLKGISYKDIGVLKCEVQTEGKAFKPSEAEVKAYPEEVVKILELIQ